MSNKYGSVIFCIVLNIIGIIALFTLSIYSFISIGVGIGFAYLGGAIVAIIETVAIGRINTNAGNIFDLESTIIDNKKRIRGLEERVAALEKAIAIKEETPNKAD